MFDHPAVRLTFIPGAVHESRSIFPRERHGKPVQGQGKPLSAGFDVSLFPCPAAKEGCVALRLRLGLEGPVLDRREVPFGDIVAIFDRTHSLHVDPEFRIETYRDHGKSPGVGHIEVQPAVETAEAWFALSVFNKLERLGISLQIAREQEPEAAVVANESFKESREPETPGTIHLGWTKQRCIFGNVFCARCQRPEMDFVRVQSRHWMRKHGGLSFCERWISRVQAIRLAESAVISK
jgi:hypothetical protein